MNIGTTIKKYRLKRGITQERLAEYLNLSVSAISQWECGKTMPDITILPILAGIFDVTTDELLGVDLSKKQEEIGHILDEYNRLSSLGLDKEKFDYIKAAYCKYPTASRIVDNYISMLVYDPNCDDSNGLLAHEDELTALCENILSEPSEDFLRYSAISTMVALYREKGDIPKAIEYAKRFPSHTTAGDEIEYVYEQGCDKWWECVRSNIYDIAEKLLVKIRNCAIYSELSAEGQIQLYSKAISLLDLIYDDGDYGFSHYHMCDLNIWIANRYIMMGDYTNAAEYLKRGLSHAKKYDELPAVTEHTSFLVRGKRFEAKNVDSSYTSNLVKRELDFIDQGEVYNGVRTMDWFTSIIEKYRPYAKDCKSEHNG